MNAIRMPTHGINTILLLTTGAAAWTLAVTADNTLDCIAFTATGDPSLTVEWTTRVDAVEQA